MQIDESINLLSKVVVYNKYAKHLPQKNRRETWEEIMRRYVNMLFNKYALAGDKKYFQELYEAAYLERGEDLSLLELNEHDLAGFSDFTQELLINAEFLVNKKVLPSMRAVQFAGPAIQKNEARIYNCSYMPSEDYRAFSELTFLLLGGTGAGYSVQYHHVEKLPDIQKPHRESKFLIGDSIEGWADAVKQLMKAYFGFTKVKPRFDYSDIREKGAQLITAGGKAPGPEPLRIALTKIEELLESKRNGDRLTTLDVHDIQCHVADAVLAGGIRRAALISLFSMDDKLMINAKSSNVPTKLLKKEFVTYTNATGLVTDPTRMLITIEQEGRVYKDVEIRASNGKFYDLEQIETQGTAGWWVANPQRGRANNSAVILRNRASKEEFDSLWQKVVDSNSGEPGIYFTNDPEYGTNPCCEISLRPYTFCNLTEVNAGNVVGRADFLERTRVAAFFGTLQAGFTDFHYLRPIWKKNTERDALIGVGITGIANGKLEGFDLKAMAQVAKEENARVAKLIGINDAARVTTVKPSGTTSCVVGTSSGIHAWHSKKYIRNMQCSVGDDLYNYFKENHPLLIKEMDRQPGSAVIGIPQIAPETATLREHETAIDLLERVKEFNVNWVKEGHRRGPNTNNVSATISVKPEEWEAVGEWMWENKDTYNGLSVLPYDGGTYKDAPFMEVSDEEFNTKLEYIKTATFDLTQIREELDNTNLSNELACAGGACEII